MPVGTTNYPASLDTADTLIRAVNAASSTIGVGGVTSGATTVPVTDATAAPASGVAWCGSEAISFTAKTGTTLTGCVRGFDGTTAAAHTAGDPIFYAPIIAAHHRVLVDALLALETLLGANGANLTPAGVAVLKSGDTMTGGLATPSVAVGTTPATIGVIRIPNTGEVYGRNAANTANIFMFSMGGDDTMYFGPAPNAIFHANYTVLNPQGYDKDTWVAGDIDPYALYVDASTDRVGIGTNTPGAKLEVAGNLTLAAGSPKFTLQTVGASQQGDLEFYDQATQKWVFYKQVDNDFALWDAAGNRDALVITTGTSLSTMTSAQVNNNLLAGTFQVFGGGAVTDINRSGADCDTRIKGNIDANLLFVDASADAVGIGTNVPVGSKLDINDDSIRVRTAKTRPSATATGVQGEIAWDANFFYCCVATNTWRRAAHSTW